MIKSVKYFISYTIFLALVMWAGFAAFGDIHNNIGFAYAAEESYDLANLGIDEAFDRLTDNKYLYNDKRKNKAVFDAFKKRKDAAIEYSINVLHEPINIGEGETIVPNYHFDVAKEVLLSFSNKAVKRLVEEYKVCDPLTRGNIIRVISKINNENNKIRNLLVDALEDTSFCEKDYDDNGKPLRVCDIAYNHLVMRYQLENVPMSIGTVYRIKVRDKQINTLKKLMKR